MQKFKLATLNVLLYHVQGQNALTTLLHLADDMRPRVVHEYTAYYFIVPLAYTKTQLLTIE